MLLEYLWFYRFGDVSLLKYWGRIDKLSICANYGAARASFNTLLEYAL